MLLESFSQAILKWLRVPPGASLRHNQPGTSSQVDVENNDYIQAILDITVDDVCIGEEPLSVSYKPSTDETTRVKLDNLCKEFNTIVKDVAYDLATVGYSVYDVDLDKEYNKIILLPYLEECEFYLTPKKEVVLFKVGAKEQVTGKLIFINYNRRSLAKEEGVKGARFKVTPTPMQLKNAERTISALQTSENSITRYRALLKPLRFANVDVGTSQGDVQKQTVDSVASAINCNSESLGNGAPFTEFDDNLPVLPNRKGLGKVEIADHVPSADLKSLADLDYNISKLNLIMRFPGTYMDFSKALSESAVSMIRGDLRYTKLVKSIQTKITSTINTYVQDSEYKEAIPVFSLTTLPSSEDDDVLEAMDGYIDLLDDVIKFVVGEDNSKEHMLQRLKMLQTLYASSTNSPMLQKWFNSIEDYINSISKHPLGESEDITHEESGDTTNINVGTGDEGLEDTDDIETFEEGQFNQEAGDVEVLEPQST